jgi:hypothetical protein
MSISLNLARMSSICSDLTSSEENKALISALVTYPRVAAYGAGC